MFKRVLLVIAAALVFSTATPSYATFWSQNSLFGFRGFTGSGQDSHDDQNQNGRFYSFNNYSWYGFDSRDDGHDQSQEENQYSFNDWSWGYGHDDCRDDQPPTHDNPVPEPATAGLAFMSLGALTAAVRRRRK